MRSTRSTPFALAVARRCAPLLVVFGLWLYSAHLTLAWLRADGTPPSWDPAVHLSRALSYYAYLTRLPLADAWAGLGLTSTYYPPLVHLVGALCWLRYGLLEPTVPGLETADVPVLGNLLFMGLLLFGTYALANRWYGERAGLLAAVLVAAYPILAGQSVSYLLDYPLTALTVVALALLAASRGLTHPRWVWPLGLVAGLAMWCKWSFLFIFGPPLAWSLVHGLRLLRAGEEPGLTPVRLSFNLAVVLAGMLLTAGPWYLSHPAATIHELTTSNQTWQIDDDPAVGTLAGWFYYLRVLPAEQLGLPLTLLALAGLVHARRRREELEGWPLLASWLVGGWVVFTLVPNKDPRFTMPLLPALAVASASWLAPRANRPRGAGLAAVVVVFALVQQVGVIRGIAWLPQRLGPAVAPLYTEIASFTRHPLAESYPLEELARDIARYTPPGGKVGVLPNAAHLNYLTVRYYALVQYLPYLLEPERLVTVGPALHAGPEGVAASTVESLAADGFDTLICLEGDQGAHARLIDETVANLERQQAAFRVEWEPVAERWMPGGKRVTVYRRMVERGP